MKIRALLDATFGRLILPIRTAISATAGEIGLIADAIYVRGATVLLRILTDEDLGTTVATLDPDTGTLTQSQIPSNVVTTDGGGSGGGSGAAGLIGEIKAWFGDPFMLPNGWFVCDGSELDQTTYASLFAVIGHRGGQPAIATKFKLPNLISRTLMGCAGPNDSSVGSVQKINVRDGGSGGVDGTYGPYPLSAFSPAIISGATVNVTVLAGAVSRIDIVTPGTVTGGITASPTNSGAGESNCQIVIPNFAGAPVLFKYDVVLAPTQPTSKSWGVKITLRGEGYTSAPAVTIAGGALVGATAIAVMEGDYVRDIVVTNPGNGDPTGATVSFSGGGSTVAATASVQFWTTPATVGDFLGEQERQQLRYEVGAHNHIHANGAGGAGSYNGLEVASTGNYQYEKGRIYTNDQRIVGDAATGNSLETVAVQSTSLMQPSMGVLFIINSGT